MKLLSLSLSLCLNSLTFSPSHLDSYYTTYSLVPAHHQLGTNLQLLPSRLSPIFSSSILLTLLSLDSVWNALTTHQINTSIFTSRSVTLNASSSSWEMDFGACSIRLLDRLYASYRITLTPSPTTSLPRLNVELVYPIHLQSLPITLQIQEPTTMAQLHAKSDDQFPKQLLLSPLLLHPPSLNQ